MLRRVGSGPSRAPGDRHGGRPTARHDSPAGSPLAWGQRWGRAVDERGTTASGGGAPANLGMAGAAVPRRTLTVICALSREDDRSSTCPQDLRLFLDFSVLTSIQTNELGTEEPGGNLVPSTKSQEQGSGTASVPVHESEQRASASRPTPGQAEGPGLRPKARTGPEEGPPCPQLGPTCPQYEEGHVGEDDTTTQSGSHCPGQAPPAARAPIPKPRRRRALGWRPRSRSCHRDPAGPGSPYDLVGGVLHHGSRSLGSTRADVDWGAPAEATGVFHKVPREP